MKFRKKPVIIEAVRWTGSNVDEVCGLTLASMSGLRRKDFTMSCGGIMKGGALIIDTLEDGQMKEAVHVANPGDWIIKGVKGEIYPCKPDIFEATYEGVA